MEPVIKVPLDKVTRAAAALMIAPVPLLYHLCREERMTHFEKLCCIILKTKIHECSGIKKVCDSTLNKRDCSIKNYEILFHDYSFGDFSSDRFLNKLGKSF